MFRLPFRIRLARTVLRPLFRTLFHLLGRVRILGLENIPGQGAYIIAANHISILEPPLVLSFWRKEPEVVAAVDIRERRAQEVLVRLYGALRVHRGEYDRKVVERALAALRAGRPLVLFPEGGRSHVPGLRQALPGVAYLIDKARVPVLPVGIVGSTEDYLKRALRGQRPELEIRIGRTIVLPPITHKGEERRRARQRNADLVMGQIAAILPLEYRGMYAETACQEVSV